MHWQKFKMPIGTSAQAFISSLQSRLAQLATIDTQAEGVWLGGFFQPEAYITATRQAVAHAKGWSLEQLVLHLEMDPTQEGFRICGELQYPAPTSQLPPSLS